MSIVVQEAKGGRGGGIALLNVKKSIFIDEKTNIKADGGYEECEITKNRLYRCSGCGSGGSIKISCNQMLVHQIRAVSTAMGGAFGYGDVDAPGYPASGDDDRICVFIEDDVNRENCWSKLCFNSKAYITCN